MNTQTFDFMKSIESWTRRKEEKREGKKGREGGELEPVIWVKRVVLVKREERVSSKILAFLQFA